MRFRAGEVVDRRQESADNFRNHCFAVCLAVTLNADTEVREFGFGARGPVFVFLDQVALHLPEHRFEKLLGVAFGRFFRERGFRGNIPRLGLFWLCRGIVLVISVLRHGYFASSFSSVASVASLSSLSPLTSSSSTTSASMMSSSSFSDESSFGVSSWPAA